MSFCRNDVANRLFPLMAQANPMQYEQRFMEEVRLSVEAGRLKPKLAEKIIIWFYQQPDKLRATIEEVIYK